MTTITINIPEKEFREVQWLAASRNVSVNNAIIGAIQLEFYMRNMQDNGGKIIVRNRDVEVAVELK